MPIPFLRASDISPIALLSDNVIGGVQQDNGGTLAIETLQELFTGDGQSKKGRRGQNEVDYVPPSISASVYVFVIYKYACSFDLLQMPLPPSVYQRLTSSSTLLNLARALAYHKMYVQKSCLNLLLLNVYSFPTLVNKSNVTQILCCFARTFFSYFLFAFKQVL